MTYATTNWDQFGGVKNNSSGILEGFGRLFKNNVKLYIYPYKNPQTQQLTMIDNLTVAPEQQHFYQYLKQSGVVEQINEYNEAYLDIFSPDVLNKITSGESGWEQLVPMVVADKIKEQKLFGYRG